MTEFSNFLNIILLIYIAVKEVLCYVERKRLYSRINTVEPKPDIVYSKTKSVVINPIKKKMLDREQQRKPEN